jgi:L-amino acid N-acyltransferase YncA
MPLIRNAVQTDFTEIQVIYTEYVLKTYATFEVIPPAKHELIRRWQTTTGDSLPYLIAELNNKVIGYAYASKYRSRSAYKYTIEDSVYVSPNSIGKGVGKALLKSVVQKCASLGYRQMIAVIGGSDNHSSINLHEKCGFYQIGTMPSTGYKLQQWVDSVMMQRQLGQGDQENPSLK